MPQKLQRPHRVFLQQKSHCGHFMVDYKFFSRIYIIQIALSKIYKVSQKAIHKSQDTQTEQSKATNRVLTPACTQNNKPLCCHPAWYETCAVCWTYVTSCHSCSWQQAMRDIDSPEPSDPDWPCLH